MSNKKLYKKTFDTYYKTAMEDTDILSINKAGSVPKKFRRLSMAIASVMLLIFSATAFVATTGLINISEIYNNLFKDPVTSNLVDAGILQELDIVEESEDFTLKLSAFTGDVETPVILLELIPESNISHYDSITLLVQSLSPAMLEDYSYTKWPTTELKGIFDEDKGIYYFSYRLGNYTSANVDDEIIVRMMGVKLHDGLRFIRKDYAMDFRFTPDISILESPHLIEVNEQFKKDIFKSIAFIDDYDSDNYHLHRGDINALTKEKTIKITDMTVSNYKTVMNGFIMNDIFSEEITLDGFIDENNLPTPSSIRNQFVAQKFITYHYWNGLDDETAYEMAPVDNIQRIRLFVDDQEMALHEETISTYPISLNEDGHYPVYMEFDGFSYEKASKIQIHFGDEIVTIR